MIDRVLRDKLLDAYMASIPLIILNVVWFLVSLPIISLIPATAALFYATNRLAHHQSADWRTFLEGFRLYLWRSWLWGLLNIVIIAAALSNILFYSRTSADWAVWVRALVFLLTVLWLALQVYMLPLMMEQEKPDVRLALRNSAVIFLKRPLRTLAWLLVIGLVAAGSTLIIQPAWIFITASLCAFLANQATLSAIAAITGKSADASDQPQ
jgi:uncharacterized membrane protein YesL